MSSLGITLAILVVVGVGGVAFYNFWLMRGHAKSLTNLLVDQLDSSDTAQRRGEPSLDELDAQSDSLTTQSAGKPGGLDSPEPVSSSSSRSPSSPARAEPDFRERLSMSGPERDQSLSQGPPTDSVAPEDAATPPRSEFADPTSVGSSRLGGMNQEPSMSAASWSQDDAADVPEPALSANVPDVPSRPSESVRSEDTPEGALSQVSASSNANQTDPLRAPVPAQAYENETPDPIHPEHLAVDEHRPVPLADDGEGDGRHAGAELATSQDQREKQSDAPDVETLASDAFHLNVLVVLNSPLPGARLGRLTRELHRIGSKPVDVLGRRSLSDGSYRFESIRESIAYDQVGVRLLLINRQGPLNAMEYSEFVSRLQHLAEDVEVLIDPPDMNDALARARTLDETVSALDAQIAVNVEVPQALSPEEFARFASRLGLHEHTSQRFVRLDSHNEPRFSAALTEQPGRILFLLDVPRASHEGQPIREVVELAWKFAQAFEGRMVDDAGQPIDSALFERIEHQLETLYHALDAQGLPAGSALTRRVFNL